MTGTMPNVLTLKGVGTPVHYNSLLGFSTPTAVASALSLLPLADMQGVDSFLRGQTITENTSLCSAVREMNSRKLAGTHLAAAREFVSKGILADFKSRVIDGGAREWSYTLRNQRHLKTIFGKDTVLGKFELQVRTHEDISRIVLGPGQEEGAEDGESAAPLAYTLSIREFSDDGKKASGNRIETTLAGMLGLHQGLYAVGVTSVFAGPVGFKTSPDGVVAVPFRKFMHALDAVINTDMVNTSIVASALYSGSRYLNPDSFPAELGAAICFGKIIVPISQQEGVSILAALRLVNMEPARMKLAEKSESGLLHVTGTGRMGIELLLLPQGALTFDIMSIQAINEVAKACGRAIVEGMPS